MKKRLVAFIFIVVLAVGLVPGLELVAPQDVLSAAGITGTSQALAEESTTTSKITVTRVSTGKLAMRVGKRYKLGAKTTVGTLSYKSSNEKMATVSSKGAVRAKSAGKTTQRPNNQSQANGTLALSCLLASVHRN
ncbi:MAG: hypothetical protein IKG22_00965 [Atopobiaceae bacterium]|nr:hypothetical protein [Atopobiaceae bacterium]